MTPWSDHLLPRLTDVLLGSPDVRRQRVRALHGLHGDVVEIGFGSGPNVALYPAEVTSVAAVEPSTVARGLAADRIARSPVPVRFVGLDGQSLPLPDASCDAAVSTFTLCTVPDPHQALLELRRVLRPGGRLHLLEHGLSPDPRTARWQHRLDGLEHRVAGGCHLTRSITDLLTAAGFTVDELVTDELRGPRLIRPWGHLYLGVAATPPVPGTPGAGPAVTTPAPRDDPASAESHWEGFYRESTRRWSGRPNPVLVEVAGTLTPGRALDLGCGEGGDVLWLARRGFTVTGVDISTTVTDRARAHADEAGLADRVTIARHDLAATFPAGEFDLVSAQYLHSPTELPRADILRRAAHAVAPGGTLLVVGHATLPPWAPDPAADIAFPTPQDVLDDLALPQDQWRIERAETTDRDAAGPDGRTGTLTDAVVVLTRRPPTGRLSPG